MLAGLGSQDFSACIVIVLSAWFGRLYPLVLAIYMLVLGLCCLLSVICFLLNSILLTAWFLPFGSEYAELSHVHAVFGLLYVVLWCLSFTMSCFVSLHAVHAFILLSAH